MSLNLKLQHKQIKNNYISYRYFQCEETSKVRVKFNVASCGTELEDKVFFEIDGIQLGQDIELGCVDGSRPVQDTTTNPQTDGKLLSACSPLISSTANLCNYEQYKSIGSYNFDEITEQIFLPYTSFQVISFLISIVQNANSFSFCLLIFYFCIF